jgi:hypothetical protein
MIVEPRALELHERIHLVVSALAQAGVPDDTLTAHALLAMGVTCFVRDGAGAVEVADSAGRLAAVIVTSERAARLVARAQRDGEG